MTPERLRRVEEVFFTVAALRPEEQGRHLPALCNGDDELRTEVEALLEHQSGIGDFLDRPAIALPGSDLDLETRPITDELIGATLGAWKVERRIASGGMGTVYLGSRADGQFQQQVAIKVVKRGMDSEELLKRFRRERRTLAALNHPNIARLLDAGMAHDGRPYLVMEYVPGIPIDRYCDEHRLTIEGRLRLFRVVCEAVRAAHRNLIVHRDLKPGNILVAADGTPKLLDFGIAKLLGAGIDATRTMDSERRLTPEYASPEQIAGLPLTTATDVYSLGVILYELLCGRKPYRFETASPTEMERIIALFPITPPSGTGTLRTRLGALRELEQPDRPELERAAHERQTSPSRLRRTLRGDLDNIALMALRKEPERRYASVEELGADIGRYLNGLPVLARADTFRYRAAKFVSRHAVGVTLGSLIMVLAVTAVVGIAWQGRRAARERDSAYLARDQAEAVVAFLQAMLSSADPANEGPQSTVRAVLDRTAVSVAGELRGQPKVQATVLSTIGQSYRALGLLDEAEKNLNAAYTMRLNVLGADHHDVAESKIELAHLRYDQTRYAEAETLLRESLEMHQRQRGHDNPDTSRVLNDLGAVLRAQGRIDEAERVHEEALRIRRATEGEQSLAVAESLNNLAGVRSARGDAAGAIKLTEQSLEIRRAILPPEHPLLFNSLSNLAVMEGRAGNTARAESLLEEAVALGERSVGPTHFRLGQTLTSLGGMRMVMGRYAEAEPVLRRAVGIAELRLPGGHPLRETARVNLARCLLKLGDADEGAPMLRESLGALRGADGHIPDSQLGGLDELRAFYRQQGRDDLVTELEAWSAPKGG